MTNIYNISNLPVVNQYGQHIGYEQIPIDPTLRQKTMLQSSPTATSNVWYSRKRYSQEPTSGLLIGFLVIVIALFIIAIIWSVWRLYYDNLDKD